MSYSFCWSDLLLSSNRALGRWCLGRSWEGLGGLRWSGHNRNASTMKITESPKVPTKKNATKTVENDMTTSCTNSCYLNILGDFSGELHLIQTVTGIRFLYKLNGNLTKKIKQIHSFHSPPGRYVALANLHFKNHHRLLYCHDKSWALYPSAGPGGLPTKPHCEQRETKRSSRQWRGPQKLECEILWNHKSINQHSEKLPKAWNLQTFIEIADETRYRLYMHVAGSASRHMETLKWSVLHQPEVSCHFSFVSQQLSVDLRESQPTKYRN